MNDLISRSELLKAMDTWNKFGYDYHRGLIRIDSTNNEEYVPFVHYEDMVKCVNDMQTAYDVDKVVEELEMEMKASSGYSTERVSAFSRAIEIVKQGVVSDDMCEWKKHRIIDNVQMRKTSCLYEIEEKFVKKYRYCPYCGKKIKVVE